jgi:iron complex outermembrane receptor protein
VRGLGRPGDYNSRALLLIDGHRANDNIYESALIGPEAIVDLDLVDRVEVIRGPASSVYGSSAFFGVYNVLLRRGRDIQGVELSSEAGSFDAYKGRITAGYGFKSGFEFLLSGSYYDSRGPESLYFPEFDTPPFNHGVAKDLDYERNCHLLGKVAYGDFTLTASWNSREKGIPTAAYGAYFDDPREQAVEGSRFVDLKHEREFENGLRLVSRAAYHRYAYDGWYAYNAADPADSPLVVLNRDIVAGEWWGLETTASREFFGRLTLTAGVEFRHNFQQDQKNLDEGDPALVYGDVRSSSHVTGLYAQGDWALLTNLVLRAGLRYDRYSTFGDTVNPRVGAMFAPWEPTTFKLLYGSAFRAPNAYESSFMATYFAPNPNLNPEQIDSYELVWEQRLSPPLRLASSLYYSRIDNLIDLDDSGPVNTFNNSQPVRAYGAEVAVQGRWGTKGLAATVSDSAQRTRLHDTDEALSNSPRHLAKVHLRDPLWRDRIFAGAEVQHVSSVLATREGRVDGYWLANLTLFGRELVQGLELSTSIYNLFDTAYAHTGSDEQRQRVIPQDGRTFRVQLTDRF